MFTKNESTALIRATERGHIEVVKALISHKADLDRQNKVGIPYIAYIHSVIL